MASLYKLIQYINILINDRKKTIAKIQIRYDVTNKQDIEEQIALYEKYKKEIQLNPFYDNYFCNVTDMPLDKVDPFIIEHSGCGMNWYSFLMYIDLFYGIEELDDEIINQLYKYQLYHYHSCYVLVQYYDRQAYNIIIKKLPNCLTVLPEKIIIKIKGSWS